MTTLIYMVHFYSAYSPQRCARLYSSISNVHIHVFIHLVHVPLNLWTHGTTQMLNYYYYYHLLLTPTMSVGVGRIFESVSLFCPQHNSKTNDPKVLKLGVGNGYPRSGTVLDFKCQRSRVNSITQ